MDVKWGDEIDIVSVIEEMGKFGKNNNNFECNEVEITSSSFGFGFGSSNNTYSTSHHFFPSFNNNIRPPPSTHSVAPPSFPPYSAAARCRSHLPATPYSAMKGDEEEEEEERERMGGMREMIYRIAAMQPIEEIEAESVKPPKRRNVKISKDPQSVAARLRRERISERIRILQRIVPGGTKMDTASMLDEAIHYLKFLKNQLHSLQIHAAANNNPYAASARTPHYYNNKHYFFQFPQPTPHSHVEDA